MGSGDITIAIDAMGSDNAPISEVKGAAEYLAEHEHVKLILAGDEGSILKELKKCHYDKDRLTILPTTEVIDMHESPTEAIKKKPDSSLVRGLKLQREKKADAFISAGNTGAVMASSLFILGRISNITRPTIGSIFPTDQGTTILFDVGANVDSKPVHLLEAAVMGVIYANHIYDVDKPRVALLNVGEEKSKGDMLSVETYELLENSGLNFIGNVEGRDILRGKAEVIVCDGFVGNVVLKFAESVLDVLRSRFRQHAEKSIFHKVWVGMMYGTLKKILKDFDYQEHGGVPLLGVNGVSIIGHGRSSPKAIKTMLSRAEMLVKKQVNEHIAERVKDIKSHIPPDLIKTK